MGDAAECGAPWGAVGETDDVGVKAEVVIELKGALEATLARAGGGEVEEELIPGGQTTVIWAGEEGHLNSQKVGTNGKIYLKVVRNSQLSVLGIGEEGFQRLQGTQELWAKGEGGERGGGGRGFGGLYKETTSQSD